jgi:hypothetical protein
LRFFERAKAGMTDPTRTTSLREATLDLHRYLSGEIAPLFAIDTVAPFVSQPPQLAASIITEWIEAQYRGTETPVPVSDLIFHALKKLHDFSEFDLIVRAQLERFLADLARLLVQVCPEDDRDELRIRISRIGEAETVLTSRAEYLHREFVPGQDAPPPSDVPSSPADRARRVAAQPPHEAPPAATTKPVVPAKAAPPPAAVKPASAASAPTSRDMKRLAVLLDRLERVQIPPGSPLPKTADTTVLAQTITTAALHSKDDEELGRNILKVEGGGVAPALGKLFRALSWNLPGWTLPGGPSGEAQPPPPGRPIQAMNRIVALAPDAQERAKRWGEMIYAAIEQLNEGRLAQAVSIIEAAKRLIAEKQADTNIVKQVLGQAQEAISEDVLRRLVEVPEKHGLVRKVLEFFPAYRPDGLLTSLDGELRRERRKLFLALLECHGRSCRDAVLTRLAKSMNGEPPDELGYYRRNLAFLLRRIPRDRDERLEEEIFLLSSMIARGEPAMSAKEAIGALGQLRLPEVEKLLVKRLHELETQAIFGRSDEGTWELLDRICAALARHGTRDAIRAVAGHAFNRSPNLGDAMARFEHFSRIDLTVDPEQLAIILETIRTLVPTKVLGIVVKKSNHDLACLMHAVSGTPAEEVRMALRDIAAKLPGHALGEQAEKALAKLDPRAVPATAPDEALSGDLELFGLPGLLQSLESSQSSGELFLFDKRQVRQATIAFASGRVVRSAAGRLSGEDALYQILEKPFPGTFVFRAVKGPADAAPAQPLDLLNIILEGLRRHDEYQLARALAPEGVSMEPGSAAAYCPEEETDATLARSVWAHASAGAPPEVCEAQVPTDPFRVRRLLAYWVEQGALKPRMSPAPA